MILDAHGNPIARQPLTDEQLLALVVDEMRRYIDTPLILGPFSAPQGLELAGLLQLASRHPQLGPNASLMAADVVDAIREFFADAPATLELINRGDDPSQDR
jgi:hypothetical protein